jgi:hypothetical protein
MFKTLYNQYGRVEPFYGTADIYYLREFQTNRGYHIFIKPNIHVCNSNGNNYPPKIMDEPKVYITYNNEAHPDGAGSQIQRIILLYLAAKKFNLGYIHTPIKNCTYQGLQCLINNENDNEIIHEYNKLIEFEPNKSIIFNEQHSVSQLNHQLLNHIINNKPNKNVLIKCTYCLLADEGMIDLLDIKLPFSWINTIISTPLIIAIHIRRGELYVVDSERMLPNSYYIEIIKALTDILGERPYELHIHTEEVTQNVVITPEHHGIMNRTNANVTLTPNDNKFEEFNCIPNITFHINEDPIKTFKDLTNADVLIASRSSFSYTAAILKSKGVVLFHPFWHCISNNWIATRSAIDVYNNKNTILKKLS